MVDVGENHATWPVMPHCELVTVSSPLLTNHFRTDFGPVITFTNIEGGED